MWYSKFMKTRQRQWDKHVDRMDPQKLPKICWDTTVRKTI